MCVAERLSISGRSVGLSSSCCRHRCRIFHQLTLCVCTCSRLETHTDWTTRLNQNCPSLENHARASQGKAGQGKARGGREGGLAFGNHFWSAFFLSLTSTYTRVCCCCCFPYFTCLRFWLTRCRSTPLITTLLQPPPPPPLPLPPAAAAATAVTGCLDKRK